MTDDRLSWLLDLWRDWVKRPDHRHELGYPSTAAGIRFRAGSDFDSMVDNVDNSQAMAVDAAIDSLPPLERTAVHHVLIASVYRAREPLQDVYLRARVSLKISLNRRGIE
jgi:hypothetical protein